MQKCIDWVNEHHKTIRTDHPDVRPGDTVSVAVKVTEGSRSRFQAFEGTVMTIRRKGVGASMIVRKIAHGVAVERTFQTNSPDINITIKQRGLVRRAKLYYLRGLFGRKARIKQKVERKKRT